MQLLHAIALVPVLALALCELIRLRRSQAALRRESRTDALTGCWNKRRWLERTTEMQDRREGFGFVLLDLANLKAANEILGHVGADDVLAEIAGAVRADVDEVYRTGGDELAVLLPGARLVEAKAVRDRIEARIGIRFLAPAAPVFLAGGAGTWRPGSDFAARLRAADRSCEERKAATKRSVGAPVTRQETLAQLAVA